MDTKSLYAKLFGTRIVNAAGGIASMIVIASRYEPEQYGAIYTLIALVAASIFCELGLPGLVLFRASVITRQGEWPSANPVQRSRLAMAYFRHYWLMTFVCSALILGVLLPVGAVVQSKYAANSSLVWTWCCVAAAVSLPLSYMLNFMEGLGFISYAAEIRAVQALVSQLVFLLVLFVGGGADAIALQISASFLSGVAMLRLRRSDAAELAASLLRGVLLGRPAWMGWSQVKEDIRLQWRLMLSYASGYFSNQAWVLGITLCGEVALAGRAAMVMQLVTAAVGFSVTPLAARLALMSSFAQPSAQENYLRIAGESIRHAAATLLMSMLGAAVGYFFVLGLVPGAQGKLLDTLPALTLLSASPFVFGVAALTLLNQSLGRDDLYLVYILRIAAPLVALSVFGMGKDAMSVGVAYLLTSTLICLAAVKIHVLSHRRVFGEG